MKTLFFPGLAAALALAVPADAQQPAKTSPPPPAPTTGPAPIYESVPPQPAAQVYVYEQKPLPQQPALIPPQQAQEIVDRFRTNYPRLESPRMLIYVNRELVDEQSGLKLGGRKEKVETMTQENSRAADGTNAAAGAEATTSKSTVKNSYYNQEKALPSLADRQTVRDVERLFGRPLRLGSATLVDQRVATQMLGDKPFRDLAAGNTGQQAAKDREAIANIADVVVEVLISSRNVTVAEVSGDKIYTVPDIQATAIRLKDSKILGQASASDVMHGSPGYAARNFGVQDITEATALALMEDMQKGL